MVSPVMDTLVNGAPHGPSASASANVAILDRRGDRLSPKRGTRLYWHLMALKTELDSLIGEYIAGSGITTLLDYGCGNMPYRRLLEPHVIHYLGYDLKGNALADAALGPHGTLPVEANSVECVLSSQVLEHVPDPALYLSEAFRVLRPGALLILSTHGAWRYHPDPTDFWRWTSDGLRMQVERAGFEILRFRGVMGPVSTALQLLQDASLNRVPKWLRGLFVRVMQASIQCADKRCKEKVRNREACVFVLVARRPQGART